MGALSQGKVVTAQTNTVSRPAGMRYLSTNPHSFLFFSFFHCCKPFFNYYCTNFNHLYCKSDWEEVKSVFFLQNKLQQKISTYYNFQA